MPKFTIVGKLPGLNEVISANRSHYHKGAKLKRAAQAIIAPQLPRRPIPGCNHYRFTWYAKDKRRDPDNIASAQKFILDAMVAGGIIENDGWKQVASITHRFAKGPDSVEVEISRE